MTTGVSAWKQAGYLYVWRYAILNRSRRGWHFHADRAGCESIADLIDRMVAGGTPSHRTLALGAVTPEIWALPNFGPPKGDRFARLRIEYRPGRRRSTSRRSKTGWSSGSERSGPRCCGPR